MVQHRHAGSDVRRQLARECCFRRPRAPAGEPIGHVCDVGLRKFLQGGCERERSRLFDERSGLRTKPRKATDEPDPDAPRFRPVPIGDGGQKRVPLPLAVQAAGEPDDIVRLPDARRGPGLPQRGMNTVNQRDATDVVLRGVQLRHSVTGHGYATRSLQHAREAPQHRLRRPRIEVVARRQILRIVPDGDDERRRLVNEAVGQANRVRAVQDDPDQIDSLLSDERDDVGRDLGCSAAAEPAVRQCAEQGTGRVLDAAGHGPEAKPGALAFADRRVDHGVAHETAGFVMGREVAQEQLAHAVRMRIAVGDQQHLRRARARARARGDHCLAAAGLNQIAVSLTPELVQILRQSRTVSRIADHSADATPSRSCRAPGLTDAEGR